MDIASIYVKNMLWSLSFGTVAQAVCVHCSERKSSLCEGPVPCPTSMPFVQAGICCDCLGHLGKFYALSAYCRVLRKGKEKKKVKSKEINISSWVLQI